MERINKEGAKKHADKGKELLAPGSKQDLEAAISEFSKAIFRELACSMHHGRHGFHAPHANMIRVGFPVPFGRNNIRLHLHSLSLCLLPHSYPTPHLFHALLAFLPRSCG